MSPQPPLPATPADCHIPKIQKRPAGLLLPSLPDLKEEERRVIEHMTHMLVRKMLREPMTYLHEHAGTEKESAGKSAVETLFSLDMGKGKAVER